MSTQTLPNQSVTWAELSCVVEEFSEWQQRSDRKFSDEHTELLAYMKKQLKAESESLISNPLKHPVLGLIS